MAMRKLKLILLVIFAKKFMLVWNGKKGKRNILTTYSSDDMAKSGNAIYFR